MNRLCMSRKADWSPMKFFDLFLFMIIATIVIIMLINMYGMITGTKNDIPDGLEDTLILQGILSSKECFAYQDETGRVYPHIIDFDKFNNETLWSCIDLLEYNEQYRFRITLDKDYIATTSGWYGDRFDRSVSELISLRYTDGKKIPVEMKVEIKRT